MVVIILFSLYIFLNGTPTTEFYTYCHTLSLLDALPISRARDPCRVARVRIPRGAGQADAGHDPAAGGARCTRRTRARSAAGIGARPLRYGRLGRRRGAGRAQRRAGARRCAEQAVPRRKLGKPSGRKGCVRTVKTSGSLDTSKKKIK